MNDAASLRFIEPTPIASPLLCNLFDGEIQ